MEKKYLSKRYQNMKGTAMGASDVAAKSFNDVINLSLGDPDMITPEIIIDKAFEDAKAGHTKYTDFRGYPELRDEIRKFYKEEYGLDVKDEEVFVCTSGCIAMYLVMEAILNDGDEVILQGPYFTPYPGQVTLARGIPVEMPTYEEEDFQINTERLESMINEKTRAIVLNSPNNPTGSCLTLETMEKVAEIVKKHDLILVADEIYTSFSYENKFIPFRSIEGMAERTITINSFSKNFVMTGWRIGNIIAPDYIVDAIKKINEGVAFTAPSISQRAALHALRHRNEVQPKIVNEFRERMFYAAERINQIPNMHVIYPPKGSFYLFPNIKATGLTSKEVADRILQEAHVLVLPGDAFGSCGEGHLRICCTVGKEKLEEAFNRISKMDIFR